MKKTLLVVVTMALIIGLCAGVASAKSENGNGQGQGQELVLQSETQVFTDVEGHWAAWAINKAKARGIFEGFEDGTFKPEDFMTNAQALVLLDRLTADDAEEIDDAEEDEGDTEADKKDKKNDSIDIDEDSLGNVPPWAKSSVQDAVYKGYIKRFHSEKQCLRIYALAIIAQGIYSEEDLQDLPPDYVNPFSDLNLDNQFAGLEGELNLTQTEIFKYVMMLHYDGIIKGSDGNLNPGGALKRAEAAVLMDQVSEYLDKDSEDDGEDVNIEEENDEHDVKDKNKDNEDEEDDDLEDDTEE